MVGRGTVAGPAPARPRQYANGVARRAEILDAAFVLFRAGGFRAVSLRDIGAAVGISHQGILRHFASTDEILLALLESLEEANRAWIETQLDGLAAPELMWRLAEHNAATPGYVPLFTAMAGEATSPGHPAHAYFAGRYDTLRDFSRTHTGDGEPASGALLDLSSPVLAAAWDGLQLQSCYASDVIDVPRLLRRRLVPPGQVADTEPRDVHPDGDDARDELAGYDEPEGYAPGRASRAAIMDHAAALFADLGFQGTSISGVAAAAGVGKSTLLHHFATKDELLRAVLVHTDSWRGVLRPAPAEDRLRSVLDLVTSEQAAPRSARLHYVLVGEASGVDHPAHAHYQGWMRRRRQFLRTTFAQLRDDGRIDASCDPWFEAVWLAALFDGLQFQWLYNPDSLDVRALLSDHLRSLGIDPDA